MARVDLDLECIGLQDGDHAVHFYSNDDELAQTVGGYLSTALLDGETVIIFATSDHLEAFRVFLVAAGVDLRIAQQQGRLAMFDAEEFLERFMVDGAPDPRLFNDAVGQLVRRATLNGQSLRAYGEMVALLWDAGNVVGAIELERLWERLGATSPFSLLCTYTSELVSPPHVAAAFAEVCSLHSQVVGGAPAPQGADIIQRFAATVHAARLARSFATDTLNQWGLEDLLDDVRLVVSELASNAVLYAGSDFTVSLSRRSDGVHMEVADSGAHLPIRRPPDPISPGGQGLHIVARVTSRWGHRSVRGGKVVWADFAEPV